VDMPDAVAAQQLSTLLPGSPASRLAVLGSISYSFPPIAYKAAGPAATREICETAARAATGAWSQVLMGGTWDGPQRSFAEIFGQKGLSAVHVLPNSPQGKADLQHLLFEEGDLEAPLLKKRHGPISLAFVGQGFSKRNCILAGLCPQAVFVGGGPGTYTEVMAARKAGVGLLPLVRGGGLIEGIEFEGKHVRGIGEALRASPAPGMSPKHWHTILGLDACGGKADSSEAPCSLKEYLAAIDGGFQELQALHDGSLPPNTWPLTGEELVWWQNFKESTLSKSAAS